MGDPATKDGETILFRIKIADTNFDTCDRTAVPQVLPEVRLEEQREEDEIWANIESIFQEDETPPPPQPPLPLPLRGYVVVEEREVGRETMKIWEMHFDKPSH